MLQFGIIDRSTHQLDKNSKVIFIFRLSFYHFQLILIGLIFNWFDSFGINFQSQFESFFCLDRLSVKILIFVSFYAKVLKYESVRVELRIYIVCKRFLPI
jgi:hypothetical protein